MLWVWVHAITFWKSLFSSRSFDVRLLCKIVFPWIAQKNPSNISKCLSNREWNLIEMHPWTTKKALGEALLAVWELLRAGHHLFCFACAELNRICRRKQQMKACLRHFLSVCVCVCARSRASLFSVRVCMCVSVHPYQSIQSPSRPASWEVLR